MEMPEIGAKHMGIAAGLYFSIGEIGGFSGPFLIGFLRDLTGSFMAGLIIISIYTGAMIILVSQLRE